MRLGAGFLKKKLLAKRESGRNGSVYHRMRGFAGDNSQPDRENVALNAG